MFRFSKATTFSTAAKLPPLYATATWLFALLLVGVFCLGALNEWRHIDGQQIIEARRSARFTEQALYRELTEQRRMVKVFSELHATALHNLQTSPNNSEAYDTVHNALKQFFPSAFAFTLADHSGTPLIDDFDGLVGNVCQQNIRHFARAGLEQPVFVHPHPDVYHYDIMVPFAHHIFFVSFKLDSLVQALRENASLGQSLYLLKAGSSLIEISPTGSRQTLNGDNNLSPEAMAALLVKVPVRQTQWHLVVLPDTQAVSAMQRKILWGLAGSCLGLLGLTALMLWFLRQEAGRRLQAEDHAQAMTHLSNTDALSGLANRRALDDALSREWQWMERSGQTLTVMMIDIDHFKFYNDHFGHPQGDTAICTVAQALWRVANRPRDMVGRFGGEEFLVILPDTPMAAGPHLAESIHSAMREAALPHPASPTAPFVTLSIGMVSATPGLTRSPSQLLHLADQALYAAKNGGRNQTVALPEPTPIQTEEQ